MTREVFIAHVEREQEALRGFLLALCCGKKDDADDLAQDALVKAYLSSAGYQDKGKFRSWLFKIAYNTFLNLKQHQEATIRRYKMMMVVAFMVGIVSGAVSIGYVLSTPTDEPLFTFQAQTGILLWLAENSRLIAATGLSLLMTLGIISIISNVQDIQRMRVCIKA